MKHSTLVTRWLHAASDRIRGWDRVHRGLAWSAVAAVAALAMAWWTLSEPSAAPDGSHRSVKAARSGDVAGRRAPVSANKTTPQSEKPRAHAPPDVPAPPLDWERVPLADPRSPKHRAVSSHFAEAVDVKLGDAISHCTERWKPPAVDKQMEHKAMEIQLELRLRETSGAFLVEDTVFAGGDISNESLQSCLRDVFGGEYLSAPTVHGGTAYRWPFTIWF